MITITANEKYQINGLCADCVFVAAKCADDGIKECPYFAKESAMCEANSNAVLAEVRAIIQEELNIINSKDAMSSGIKQGLTLSLYIIDRKIGEHFS